MNRSFLAVILAGSTLSAAAQDENDALRFSFLSPQGTARSIGFGSALGSIGGDFTSLSVNPAGIGIYRKSEFMVSPTLTFNGVDARYAGDLSRDNGTRFAVGNVGAVFTASSKGKRYKSSSWKAVSVGFGLNRMAEFSRDYSYTGRNDQNSASFVFEEDANADFNNYSDESRPAYLGYQAYLLDTASGGGFVSVVNPSASSPVQQTNSVKERGGINELVFSLGGNYQERLMLGATIGVPLLRYERNKLYSEDDLSGNANNDFSYFSYNENLRTNGAGINIKLGAIFKPNDQFRIGAAVHSPTYYSLTDASNTSLTANTESFGGTVTADGPERQYDYNLTTPWRGILSASVLLGKYGFLTADYEYVDYSATRYTFGQQDRLYEQYINQVIRNKYQAASNVRAGLEIRLDNFMLRAGAGYYGSPYQSSYYSDGQRLDVSGGIGFRFANSFIDLSFTHRWWNNPEQPYALSYTNVGAVPTADLRSQQNNVVLTTGWKF